MSTNQPIPIAIVGAAGRMGQRLCALAMEIKQLELIEASDVNGHGRPAAWDSEVTIQGKITTRPRVVVEFAFPVVTRQTIAHCQRHGQALVIGTTGLTDDDQKAIDAAAKVIPICQATNFSLVVNVMRKLAGDAANLLGPGYDIEIHEAHHRHKKDAPSGTALSIARAICDATGRDFQRDVLTTRSGPDVTRKPNEITIQSLRMGDVVGEHTVHFACGGERMQIKHISSSRDSYATGALHAAAYLAGQQPGRYTMKDVLGLNV
jgi:4-hydroxy-tetrahydrodipicolinate reductase